MVWWNPTSNLTFAAGDTPTAAKINKIRDDLNDLDRRSTMLVGFVATSQTTTSTSYASLATAGPSATAVIGASGNALVIVTCQMNQTTSPQTTFMGFDISGATTISASDGESLAFTAGVANDGLIASAVIPATGLNPGSTTFTAKYRVTGGTGSFQNRFITVVPLNS